MKLSFDDEDSFKEVAGSLRFNNPPSDPDISALRELEAGNSSIPPRAEDSEGNEGIRFINNSPNSVGRAGGSTSTPPQERSEDIDIVAA
jgi:hypothetical protein